METLTRKSWPLLALKSRCPKCGEGDLFNGFLVVAPTCNKCGLDLTKSDPGDGPAVFVIFVVGFVAVTIAFVLQMTFHMPVWLIMIIVTILVFGLSLWLLRLFKAALVILQFKHDAHEGKLSD